MFVNALIALGLGMIWGLWCYALMETKRGKMIGALLIGLGVICPFIVLSELTLIPWFVGGVAGAILASRKFPL